MEMAGGGAAARRNEARDGDGGRARRPQASEMYLVAPGAARGAVEASRAHGRQQQQSKVYRVLHCEF